MQKSDLGFLVKIPVPCPSCGQEAIEAIRWLEENTHVTCPHCKGRIDVGGEDWRSLIQEFVKVIQNVGPRFANFEELAERGKRPPVKGA